MRAPFRLLPTAAMLAALMMAAGCAPVQTTTDTHKPPDPVVVRKPPADRAAAARFESLLNVASARAAAARDVQCRLVRREMVNGTLQGVEELEFRQRFAPHSLRLKWVGDRFEGRELIYVAGANGNNVLVKEAGGLAGWLTGNKPMSLALDNPLVKGQSRYAPDVAGYNNLVKRVAKLYREARAVGLAWVEPPQENPGAPSTACFEVTLEPLLLDGDVRRMTITFDAASSLMAHALVYDAKGRLVEDYDWQNLRLNVGLTDADFSFDAAKQGAAGVYPVFRGAAPLHGKSSADFADDTDESGTTNNGGRNRDYADFRGLRTHLGICPTASEICVIPVVSAVACFSPSP